MVWNEIAVKDISNKIQSIRITDFLKQYIRYEIKYFILQNLFYFRPGLFQVYAKNIKKLHINK